MKDTKADKIGAQMFHLAVKVLQVSEAAHIPGLSGAAGMQDSLQYIIYCCYMFAIHYYLCAIRKMIIFTLIFSSILHFLGNRALPWRDNIFSVQSCLTW